ncbi:2'-5' RNA ligase family protein [Natronocalculus amylovorans]|uniref:2'-5' RNA ligase family protein n=1 Tax=Natronocalculus amylovorans TaxID=2917812 RepID=A0AAE3FVC7_9EURY|nr:2'-5' RNA ligase family protein [Natronocalculus amylovorans]MCL9816039.1 2'-5' RNA ligase family protein [Natronocalculus amylovorans]NUE01444.1 2'-5' RNA ligase family protein [Halorubraceae archaeon YAN]
MFSVNVPVSGRTKQLANRIHPDLIQFQRMRDRHTLVLKRFDDSLLERGLSPNQQVAAFRHLLRPLAANTAPFTVRATHIDTFDEPPVGSAPVVYLAIESEPLMEFHRRLVSEFGPIDGLEGEKYTPHVTLARGGATAVADRLSEMTVDPIEWRVTSLDIWDPQFREIAGRISLTE